MQFFKTQDEANRALAYVPTREEMEKIDAHHERPDPQARTLTARHLREARRRLAERIAA